MMREEQRHVDEKSEMTIEEEKNVDQSDKAEDAKKAENTEKTGVVEKAEDTEKKGIIEKVNAEEMASGVIGASVEGYERTYLRNLLAPLLFFIGTIIYLELVVHFLIYRSMDGKIIYPVLFAIPFGCILTAIVGFFGRKLNRILLLILTLLVCLVYQVQLVYYYIFKMYFSFRSLGLAQDAITNFYHDALMAIWSNLGGLISLLLPFVILTVIMLHRIDCSRRKIKIQAVLLGGSVIFHAMALLALLIFGKADYSPYDLYFNDGAPELCGQQLGIAMMSRLDIHSLFSEKELLLAGTKKVDQENNTGYELAPSPLPAHASAKTLSVSGVPQATEGTHATKHTNSSKATVSPSPVPIDTSPNIMDFDFNALADQERDKTIQKLHRYFATVTPTNKNKYTGMFKGYNLIMITAEGFSPYAISKEKTPTLYRLAQEGFVFNQFYTALWQTSTSDGEYVAMTGLIPSGTRSMYLGRKNLWPMSLGHQFNLLGVESKAYHNHTYTYYQRNETHTNLGYLWKAKGNGLELPTDCWPESDLEMMDATVEEYTDEEQFHVYYLTVSGHMNYTFTGNSIANKNRHLVEDLPYSNDVKAYIACQMELDMALEKLIAKLNEAGVADRTVIALSADHYPYGWEKNNLDELAGHEIDPVFEIYRNHFILWCQGMKESIVIDKPCSSLDILPTLSNLFGLSYDSRLLMGRDILSDAEPLVILSNRSFITDKVMYDSASQKTTHLTTETLPSDYIETMNKVVKNKFTVSESVRKKDYYRYLYVK